MLVTCSSIHMVFSLVHRYIALPCRLEIEGGGNMVM